MPAKLFTEKSESKLFISSKNIRNDNRKMAKFFNNSSMGRVLDVFMNNPDKPIYTDHIRLAADGLSRQSLYDNIPKLMEKGVITEEFKGQLKFFTYHSDNKLAKHLEKLRDML